MITITIKNQGAIEFEDFENAMAFVKEHPEMYEFDPQNICLYSDEPIEGLLLAQEEITNSFECINCKAHVSFKRRPEQKLLRVMCPRCESIHNIKVHDDAGAPKS